MRLSDFNYELPKEFIAQTPIEPRHNSKLMILNRKTGKLEHRRFFDIGDYLKEGDVLVANNSRVIPARLLGRKKTGARVEILLLNKKTGSIWEALVKPGRKLKVGERFFLEKETGIPLSPLKKGGTRGNYLASSPLCEGGKGDALLEGLIFKDLGEGLRLIKFNQDISNGLKELGLIPLPPYIHKKLSDPERYQTIYASHIGSAAAPTAGLHFTPELMNKLRQRKILFEFLTLHIGLDTFKPIKSENIEDHHIHTEYYEANSGLTQKLNKARKEGRRIIAVGTTSARVLETICDENGQFKPSKGWTKIYIYPGYKFKSIDGLVTNFHLPKSTLLLLVSAFADKNFILRAYEEARKENYRFFSFGDAMFII